MENQKSQPTAGQPKAEKIKELEKKIRELADWV